MKSQGKGRGKRGSARKKRRTGTLVRAVAGASPRPARRKRQPAKRTGTPRAEASGAKALRAREPRAKAGIVARAPKNARTPGALFEKLVALQARLRAPGGCPWDREQTPGTLRTFLIEESYEVLDALERGAPEELAGELGDLLLQIIFHALLAEEQGQFSISDVIEHVHDKMVRRHPHVFGTVRAGTSAEVLKNWEQIKAAERKEKERGRIGHNGAAQRHAGQLRPKDNSQLQVEEKEASILDDVPHTLPAVLEAWQLTRRAAKIGFDWADLDGIVAKLDEEMAEVRAAMQSLPRQSNAAPALPPADGHVEEEVGDLLFVAVNVARFLKIDPEIALKRANRKFAQRFRWMERQMANAGSKLAEAPRERMEELWEQSKKR
jgi:MazG family protein